MSMYCRECGKTIGEDTKDVCPQCNRRHLKSYVWHRPRKQCFFVSTIERDSSAAVIAPPRYMETIAWTFDWDTRQRGEMVAHTSEGVAFDQHVEVCRQLYDRGEYVEEKDS